MDYAWAKVIFFSNKNSLKLFKIFIKKELGLIRKPTSFMSTICDDRGQELLYAGVPISQVFEENIGIGGVLGLLWFKKKCFFI
jgi:hypothetical protein